MLRLGACALSPRDTSEGRGPVLADRQQRDVPFARPCMGHARAVAAEREREQIVSNGRSAVGARGRSRCENASRRKVRHAAMLRLGAPGFAVVPSCPVEKSKKIEHAAPHTRARELHLDINGACLVSCARSPRAQRSGACFCCGTVRLAREGGEIPWPRTRGDARRQEARAPQ